VADLPVAVRAQKIGFFQQDPSSQFLHATVAEACGFVPENLGWPGEKLALARTEALARFGLEALADVSPLHLSGGEQALVLLASLWMVRPRLILLDEPLAGLDEANARRIVDALVDLKGQGCSIVIVEHRDGVLASLVDRWFHLEGGSLSQGDGPLGNGEPGESPEPRPLGDVVLDAALSFGRADRVLGAGFSLTVCRGEIVVVRGPNGVGKSTLLATLAGLLPPQTGRITITGRVRLVGQDPWDQLCRAQVGEEADLDLGTRRRFGGGRPPGEPEATLSRVGLGAEEGRSPFLLSEGGRRRLAVACGVLSGADVLIVDEPTAGLDGESAQAVAALLVDYARAGGAVVCATHDLALVHRLGGRTITLAPAALEVSSSRPLAEVSARSPGTLDPRTGLVGFLAALAVALQPLPGVVAGTFLAAVVLSYLWGRHLDALARFCRALVWFWLFPGVILLVFVGPWEAVGGLVRLILLTLLFHRYSLTVDGKRLAQALTGWGVPYSLGFALVAAGAQVEPLAQRFATISGLLRLRLTRARSRWPSVRVVVAMMVPVIVHLWLRATRLGMNLELRGFHGRAPGKASPMTPRDWLGCLGAWFLAGAASWGGSLLHGSVIWTMVAP